MGKAAHRAELMRGDTEKIIDGSPGNILLWPLVDIPEDTVSRLAVEDHTRFEDLASGQRAAIGDGAPARRKTEAAQRGAKAHAIDAIIQIAWVGQCTPSPERKP